jgi:hypothetical protein
MLNNPNQANRSRYDMVTEAGGIIKNVEDHFLRMEHLQGLILISCLRLEMSVKHAALRSKPR